MAIDIINGPRRYKTCPKLRISDTAGLEISLVASLDIIIFNKRKPKTTISLRRCAGWSAPLLFANTRREVFSRPGQNNKKVEPWCAKSKKVSKGAKIRNRYNKAPHLTQDTNGKVTNSQLDTTNESQEVSPFPAGDHKAHINLRSQKHSNTRHKRSTKEVPPWSCK